MKIKNYLGIDIGTSGCKAAVFDAAGSQITLAAQEYDVIFSDDGGAELNSDEVIEKCFRVIRECAAQVEKRSIAALAIASQGEAFTAIGENGQSLCNAMVSSDMRSETHVQQWTERFGSEKLYKITGHTAHPMFTLFKLFWLKTERPEIWKKTKKFLCFEDLLQFRLGLSPAIAWPLAGRTMLFDVNRHCWSPEILTSLGLDSEQLAVPVPSGSVVGRLDTETAQRLGLAEQAMVVTAGHDQPVGALGAGATQAKTAMYATGTVECITPVIKKAVYSEALRRNNLCTYDYVLKDYYTTVAFSLTGGNILKWFRDEFGQPELREAQQTGINAYELLLNAAASSPTDLLVLPYFTPSGTPYFDTKTRGAIAGLRLSSKRSEVIRALLEGVALEMRLNIDILEKSGYKIKELRAIGGGAKSPKWTQLKADVTGKKIITLKVTEAVCMGAAMLACAADTGKPIAELAEKWVCPESTVYPDPDNTVWYGKVFKKYKQLYQAMKSLNI
ncbi:MAG TPA: hypothetical protein ENK44_06585 [Caldithrix abyssi]|uniref:Xylulokinase n=1 Tax=Caldithrix abyssi TaxID=187145 RepID=A0A7V4TZN9_CALAY|nr:hypothetical protein [Caldithrix abyssi]